MSVMITLERPDSADAIVLMGEGTPRLPSFAGPILSAQLVPTSR